MCSLQRLMVQQYNLPPEVNSMLASPFALMVTLTWTELPKISVAKEVERLTLSILLHWIAGMDDVDQ
jgi:hypothetical protein